MNFNIYFSLKNILLIIISATAVGCGVKSAPAYPPGTSIPSYINNFTGPTKSNVNTYKKVDDNSNETKKN